METRQGIATATATDEAPHPDDLPSERWRCYRDSPLLVSSLGRARSTAWGKCRPLKPFPNSQGYLQVNWRQPDPTHPAGRRRHSALLHRMILEAFTGPPPSPRHQGRHVNNPDPTDCRLANLAWGTRRDNQDDQTSHRERFPHRYKARALNAVAARDIIARLAAGATARELAKLFGVSQVAITAVNTGRTWSHVTGRTYSPRTPKQVAATVAAKRFQRGTYQPERYRYADLSKQARQRRRWLDLMAKGEKERANKAAKEWDCG